MSRQWRESRSYLVTWASGEPASNLVSLGRWRNWQRNGLLTRRFWVRIPGDPLHQPPVSNTSSASAGVAELEDA